MYPNIYSASVLQYKFEVLFIFRFGANINSSAPTSKIFQTLVNLWIYMLQQKKHLVWQFKKVKIAVQINHINSTYSIQFKCILCKCNFGIKFI